MNTKKIYSHPTIGIALGVLVCLLWGSLYSCIKMGYTLFAIDSKHIPSVILFAGLRFLICGFIMTAMVSINEKGIRPPKGKSFMPVFLVGLTTIIIHYSLSYIGISMCEASKVSILKQVGYLFISCFAFLFVRSDSFSIKKVVGGVLGFLGIIVVNLNGLSFSIGIGEILIVLASFFSVAGTVISKKAYETENPSYVVAYSQLMGGIVLFVIGLLSGGKISQITPKAIALMCYMCFASIVAYLLWNMLIKYNDVSKLSIIKYSEPIFGVICSGILLGESILRPEYIAAFGIIAAAIVVSNCGKNNSRQKIISFRRK